MKVFINLLYLFVANYAYSQNVIDSFHIYPGIKLTLDKPSSQKHARNLLIFYGLPNGNTTEQTMGKAVQEWDDWHFDIQHIKAQTAFVRSKLPELNIIICYLENELRSWPLWKQQHGSYKMILPHLIDSIYRGFAKRPTEVQLCGHSGGGSLIFGYLEGVTKIASYIKRISFLDANYGYDSSYLPKLVNWLRSDKKNVLNVFAYEDSQVVFKGKPIVSEKGGTWYRSHLMMSELGGSYYLELLRNDSLQVYSDGFSQVNFFLKKNPNKEILHTLQVERNGFIHTVLFGTRKENEGYEYYGQRAYTRFIK
jgi:hypothetical protein